MIKRMLIISGVLSPLAYVLAAIIGGFFYPDYNHITHSVSDLLVVGAPHREALVGLMLLSNLFAISGGIGILTYRTQIKKIVSIAAILLMTSGILGIFSSSLFPQDADPTHMEMTLSGFLHIFIVVIMGITGIIAPLLIGFGMKDTKGWQGIWIYSIISAIQFFIFGGLSPVIIVNKIPLLGIFERIPIAIYFGWLIVFYRKFYITFCNE